MTINTAWQIKIGSVESPTDFSSRVLSMNIDQSVDVNVVGRGVCSITLLNKDGALTPGGGGTYSTTDWFAQGVFVNSLTNIGGADTSTAVFHGIIIDFELVDDGVFSTVTITAQDGLSVAGKTNNVVVPAAFTNIYSLFATYAIGGLAGYPLNYPKLGRTTAAAVFNNYSGSDPLVTSDTLTYSTYADFLQTAIVPSVNDVMWPSTVVQAGSVANYNVISVPATMTRIDAGANTFEFVPSSSVTGTKLPFSLYGFSQQFNNDELITQATIKGVYTGATEQTVNSANITIYGNRTVSFTGTFVEDETAAVSMATNLINRYSNISFSPASLELTASMVESKCADAAHSQWYNLLSIGNGLWQRVLVTWTGSGASSQTAKCVVFGRSISVTPEDTVISVRLKSGIDNQSLILDNANFGLLGGDPISYNKAGIVYDEPEFIYNDSSILEQGSRLGW